MDEDNIRKALHISFGFKNDVESKGWDKTCIRRSAIFDYLCEQPILGISGRSEMRYHSEALYS